MRLLDFVENQLNDEEKNSFEVTGIPKYDKMIASILERGKTIKDIGVLMNLFVHDNNCPTCKETIPMWVTVSNAIKHAIPSYNYQQVELRQGITDELGNKISGIDLVKFFNSKGVPFIIQNGVVDWNDDNPTFKSSSFYVNYIGKIDPIRYIATIFNVENPRFR